MCSAAWATLTLDFPRFRRQSVSVFRGILEGFELLKPLTYSANDLESFGAD